MRIRRFIAPHLLLLAALLFTRCGSGGTGGPGGDDGMDPPAPPAPTSITPSAGPTPGGTPVTILGTNLAGATRVEFDGVAATTLTVVDDTMLTCTTPPGAAGPAEVQVTSSGGSTGVGAFTYVAFPPVAASDVQVDAGPAGAAAVGGTAYAICCDGPRVFVAWSAGRAGYPGTDVYFQRSDDRGATWLPEDVRVNTNEVGSSVSGAPDICCSGDNVYVAWHDDREEVVTVFFNRSTDGGTTWLASDVDVSSNNTTIASFLDLCCDGEHVHLCWVDGRLGGGGVFVNSSSDAGATWQEEDVLVNGGAFVAGQPPAPFGQPQVCCSGSNAYVSWSDGRNGFQLDLWCARSTDGGQTWSPEVRVDRDTTDRSAGTRAIHTPHAMCCDGERIYVVWTDDRDAIGTVHYGHDLYANVSTDGGLTFGATDVRVNATDLASEELYPGRVLACCEGDHLHVTWSDERDGAAHVYTNHSTDGGATFASVDERLDLGGPGVLTGPFIACGQGYVHVVWTDERTPGQTDVFCNSSSDHGTTWLPAEVRLDSDLPSPGSSEFSRIVGSGGAGLPIGCDGIFPCVVWADVREDELTMEPALHLYFGTYE